MFTKLTENEVPKRDRMSESLFEKTAEWRKLKKAIDGGLEPESVPNAKDAGGAMVQLTEEAKASMGIVAGTNGRRTISRTVTRYLTSKGLNYRVKSFQRDGLDHIVVLGPKAARVKKAKIPMKSTPEVVSRPQSTCQKARPRSAIR